MPRKSTKTDELKFNNMEELVKLFDGNTKSFNNIMKYDGITIQFVCKSDISRSDGKNEVELFCKNAGWKLYTLEDNPEFDNKFIIQFPDFTPEYTEEEINRMYIANFKWLLDDAFRMKPTLEKQFILDNTVKYVKLAVETFYRSNVNRYKVKLNDLLLDTLYRQKLNMLFMTYLDEYLAKRGN